MNSRGGSAWGSKGKEGEVVGWRGGGGERRGGWRLERRWGRGMMRGKRVNECLGVQNYLVWQAKLTPIEEHRN